MNAPKFWMVIPSLLVAGSVGLAYAKLPAPKLTDEQKAAAAAKKAKAAEGAKKAAEALARAQDRAAENYRKGKGMQPMAAPMPAGNKMMKK